MLDVLVLLGCRILPGGEPSAAGHRRARTAASAFERGVAQSIIVSGGRRWHGISEAEALSAALVRLGVPESAITLELCSLSTCENARYVARMLRARGLGRVGVVTCDWHMARALASFRRAGVEAEAVPATSPEQPLSVRARRAARERLSLVLDRWATWGWAAL